MLEAAGCEKADFATCGLSAVRMLDVLHANTQVSPLIVLQAKGAAKNTASHDLCLETKPCHPSMQTELAHVQLAVLVC